jgi:hypothetical protein
MMKGMELSGAVKKILFTGIKGVSKPMGKNWTRVNDV